MATIKAITIEYSYTFNLGNYSSVRPVATFTAELADGDEVTAVTEMLQDDARAAVESEIDRTLEQAGRAPHFRQIASGAKPPADDELPI